MLLSDSDDKGAQPPEVVVVSPTEENPPPYYLEHGSSSRENSRSRRSSVLPPLPLEARSVASFSDFDPHASSASINVPTSRPDGPESSRSFSQIRLDTRYADITGSFHIEPKPPISQLSNKKKAKVKSKPDAVFRTHSGKITVDLATTGHARDVAKASVLVFSKSGDITLNLLETAETSPRFDLEVKSKSGTVIIFIPTTYAGAIQMKTRGGTLEFLPAMSKLVQVVKSTEQESLALVGKQIAPSSQLPSDYCHVLTRSGNVFIGLRGEDSYEAKLGLWERIGVFFKGSTHDTP